MVCCGRYGGEDFKKMFDIQIIFREMKWGVRRGAWAGAGLEKGGEALVELPQRGLGARDPWGAFERRGFA